MTGAFAFLDDWYEGVKTLARHRFAERWFAFICFIGAGQARGVVALCADRHDFFCAGRNFWLFFGPLLF